MKSYYIEYNVIYEIRKREILESMFSVYVRISRERQPRKGPTRKNKVDLFWLLFWKDFLHHLDNLEIYPLFGTVEIVTAPLQYAITMSECAHCSLITVWRNLYLDMTVFYANDTYMAGAISKKKKLIIPKYILTYIDFIYIARIKLYNRDSVGC